MDNRLIMWFILDKMKRIVEGVENGRGFGKIILGLDLPLASGTIIMKIKVRLVVMAKISKKPHGHVMAEKKKNQEISPV